MDIFIKNGLISINKGNDVLSQDILATILANISYYGYALSTECVDALSSLSYEEIKVWWTSVEPLFKMLTGDDKKMDDFVVYKNFPSEIMNMSEGQYWFNQILMYWGFPNKYFTEDVKSRPQMLEKKSFKVLQLANDNSRQNILNKLLSSPARWTEDQLKDVQRLMREELIVNWNIPFKENLVNVAKFMIERSVQVEMKSAMDVLRLAIGLSDGDITLKTNSKFRNFTRKERRYLLNLLDNTTSLEEDCARDCNRWKKLLHHLHPGDYNYENVKSVYNKLYRGEAKSFNSFIETLLLENDSNVLNKLSSRPGEFIRRLRVLIDKFGNKVVDIFNNEKFIKKLSISQLLKLKKYFITINIRKYRVFPPNGNWAKLQSTPNTINLDINIVDKLITRIKLEVAQRINKNVNVSYLDPRLSDVKIQTNDSDVLPYGRGTVFYIPDNINFIRTASYWEQVSGSNNWFDNGWLFYDKDWKSIGTCCWNSTSGMAGALFSGDPTNSKDENGRACQMIDLYIDQLLKRGARYAVWNILCYSRIKFSDATKVYGTLQWGEDAQSGKLYEPSRCQLAFPITSDSYTKYVAYVDLQERKLVYIDANLKSNTNSAAKNINNISEVMPKFVEYLDTLPSVYDIFADCNIKDNGIKLLYSDADNTIEDETAYVFKQENKDSKFNQLDINKLLV